MGYLLKEALKTLCGVNQWSYAVFWKFGYQNPKLLIWEECYFELDSKSRHTWIVSGNKNLENVFQDLSNSWVSEENCTLHSGVQAQDTVHLLVNKMMMENHVNIVGEGLVGRVAFTGDHQWIISENYYGEDNLPEVVKEVCQQLSAGIKTIVVIPVLPHGVVQFGSYLSISENMGFISNVTSLVLQLGNIPGTLLSDSYAPKELGPKIGVPSCLGNSTPRDTSFDSNAINSSSFVTDSVNYVGSSIPVIPSNTEIWRNQRASLYVPSSSLDLPSGNSSLAIQNTKTISLIGYGDRNRTGNENIASKCSASSGHRNVNLSKMESSFSVSVDNLVANSLLGYSPANQPHHLDKKCAQGEFFACNEEIGQNINQISDNTLLQQNKLLNMSHSGNYSKDDDPCAQLQSGDDLFDILGADFKSKMFRSCWSSCMSNELNPNNHISGNNNICSTSLASSEACGTSQGNSDSVIFSTGTDHLLDAVVSNATPTVTECTNDSVSCRTSLTNTGTSSALNGSPLPYGRFDQVKGELFGVPKYLPKAGAMSSCSLRTFSSKDSKEEKGTYSPNSSIYGSQISSWLEKGQNTKQDNSVSTGCSKKPSETSKTNRKRLKPGENPRPRPKDRQMIQDRVKELRELVPNGAKCSIDSLLERTIKHMLFLQSVTKHADKLKQTGESKLIGKDGNLLLKENFEGGATWAYEIGLQSMVCPIIVEDLNQPRQKLVEMICEERGLFLEIADIIRGLGLTILRGVMETRNDKIWARFAVEANRDVTRMEIFISLVRLLEQSAKDVLQDKKLVQQFHQAATLPVTGISDIMH